MRLSSLTSAQAVGTDLVLVPVGSLEQHGPHLPLDTDTAIAVAVADGVAARLPGGWQVHVAPALAFGSSGEHQSFAGTCSIGTSALRHVVVELVRSLRTWADHVVLVNAHGGNLTAVRSAVEQLVDEGHRATWVACAPPGAAPTDLHAGRTETSLMLHLRPGDVRRELAVAGGGRPLGDLLTAMVAGGVAAVSPSGVLGDPTDARAEEGARLLDAMVTTAAQAVRGAVGPR